MVYVYIRVSTKKQEEEGYSLEAQETAGKAFAKSLDQSFKLYKDVESGAKTTRIGWQSLLSDLQTATDEDIIWFGSQSRLSRDAETFQHFRKLCQSRGIKLFEKRQNRYIDFATKGDRILGGIQSVLDEEERSELIERVKEGQAAAWNKGNRIHANIYGYKSKEFDPRTGNRIWTIDESEAEIIKYVYDLFVTKKLSVLQIAHTLNREGYRTKDGKYWSANLKRLLQKPLYAGLTWNAEKELMSSTQYPAIISEQLFMKANARYMQRKADTVRGRHASHLARGIIRCPVCSASWRTEKRRGKLHYRHDTYINCGCERRMVVYDVANYILSEAYMRAMMDHPERIMEKVKAEIKETETEIDRNLKRVDRLINAKQNEIENINKAIALSGDTAVLQHLANQIGKRLSDINSLADERKSLTKTLELKTEQLVSLKTSFSFDNLAKYLDKETTDSERRIMLKQVVTKALVYKDSIEIHLIDGRRWKVTYAKYLKRYRAKTLLSLSGVFSLLTPAKAKSWEKALEVLDQYVS